MQLSTGVTGETRTDRGPGDDMRGKSDYLNDRILAWDESLSWAVSDAYHVRIS